MNLLVNYGTNASSGGQPVIAEIELNQTKTEATTTFYDSYPDGNVIGTTAGTEVVGSGTTQYNLTFTQTGTAPWGATSTFNSAMRLTEVILIKNNSIILSNFNHTYTVLFYDSNQNYLGFITSRQIPPWQSVQDNYLGPLNSNEVTIPSNAVYWSMWNNSANNSTTSTEFNQHISNSLFNAITASHPESYLQIDPPTGKRIKQIALKGL
jgi:hypothetical protein